VSGRVDTIIKTVQLAVDKYIIEKEANGELPSRALVSLDIRNMFNAVSRAPSASHYLNHSQTSFTMAKARLIHP
jgi:hypothetical protein